MELYEVSANLGIGTEVVSQVLYNEKKLEEAAFTLLLKFRASCKNWEQAFDLLMEALTKIGKKTVAFNIKNNPHLFTPKRKMADDDDQRTAADF